MTLHFISFLTGLYDRSGRLSPLFSSPLFLLQDEQWLVRMSWRAQDAMDWTDCFYGRKGLGVLDLARICRSALLCGCTYTWMLQLFSMGY